MWLLRPVLFVAPVVTAGLALLGLAAVAVPAWVQRSPSVVSSPSRTLTLDVVNSEAMCVYYSSFDVQPVRVEQSDRHVELQRTFEFSDGCTWRSFETLDRVPGTTQFTYTYREAPFSCPANVTAAMPCQRAGFANEAQ